MIRSSVDLPPPLGPSSAVSCPVGQRDGDVVEGDEVAELLGDAGDVDAHDVTLPLGAERRSATTMQSHVLAKASMNDVAYAVVLLEVLVLLPRRRASRSGSGR